MKLHKWRISIIETVPATRVFRDRDSKLSWSVQITEIYPWAALEMSFHNVGRTHLGSSELQTTDRTNFHYPFSICCLQTLSPCLFPPISFCTWSPWLISFTRWEFSFKTLWHLLEDGPHSSLTLAIHSPWNKVCALLPSLLQHFSATAHWCPHKDNDCTADGWT